MESGKAQDSCVSPRSIKLGGHMQNLIRQDATVEIIIQTVLDSLDSAHSRRAYERHYGSLLPGINQPAKRR